MAVFQMHEGYRKLLIDAHLFYVGQAKKLLLSQFADIDGLAQAAANEMLAHRYFDPDYDDPGSAYEAAHDYQIEHGQMLADMYERTRLSVIAGMSQQMEKGLRDWMARELLWHLGDGHTVKWAWAAKWDDLMETFKGLGWDVQSIPCYAQLEAMMLVVNVSKHGAGPSFEDLKEKFPWLLSNIGLGKPQYHHDHLDIEDGNLEAFSAAIIQFWESVPAALGVVGAAVPAPKGFRKAYSADVEARKKRPRLRR